MSLIFIFKIRFFDFQWHYKKEKFNTQLNSCIDTEKTPRIDNLGNALKYQKSYIIIKEVTCNIQSNLLNNATENVLNAIFDAYTQLEKFKLRLRQNKPTIRKQIGCVGVKTSKEIM